MLPASRSLYRGYSREGFGEGPGKPVSRGEQYLRYSDPELAQDGSLLEELQPWLSFDLDPGDQALESRIEGWACLPCKDHQVVARMVAAQDEETGPGRYFSHGRLWRVEACSPDFDPGACLGHQHAFDVTPPRNLGTEVMESMPAMVRRRQIQAERQVAAGLLGHLFQAMVARYPLIVAVPLADFRGGGTLQALICLARAGLPAALRRRCRIRVYTRQPRLFLDQLAADLVVIPEGIAAEALESSRMPLLLDRQGRERTGRRALARGVQEYAKKTVARALSLPVGLPVFGERYQESLGAGLPTARDARWVPVIYNLAYAMAEAPSAERREGLLTHLIRQAEILGASTGGDASPWRRLIGHEEWSLFPHDELFSFIFTDPESLEAGARELRLVAEEEVAKSGLEPPNPENAGDSQGQPQHHPGDVERWQRYIQEGPEDEASARPSLELPSSGNGDDSRDHEQHRPDDIERWQRYIQEEPEDEASGAEPSQHWRRWWWPAVTLIVLGTLAAALWWFQNRLPASPRLAVAIGETVEIECADACSLLEPLQALDVAGTRLELPGGKVRVVGTAQDVELEVPPAAEIDDELTALRELIQRSSDAQVQLSEVAELPTVKLAGILLFLPRERLEAELIDVAFSRFDEIVGLKSLAYRHEKNELLTFLLEQAES